MHVPETKNQNRKKRIVVIGGGTGTHTVLKGLKKYHDDIDISAIVSMADAGGSTGRLRDTFGQLPVGDVRMALTALASDDDSHEELLRELFLYRFDKGDGLSGHNFGNLLLTALTDLIGSEAEAIKMASQLLRIRGTVLPVTADDVHLVAEYDDKTTVIGEQHIDDPPAHYAHRRINALYTEPLGTVGDDAFAAIVDADLIVLGPGDLYSSLLANCVIQGVPEAFAQSSAQVVYVSNLMTRPGQTRGMTIGDHVRELARYLDRCPDIIIKNNAPLPEDLIEHYRLDGDEPLPDDTHLLGLSVMERDLLLEETITQGTNDTVKRSLLRHDSDKLAAVIVELVPHLQCSERFTSPLPLRSFLLS